MKYSIVAELIKKYTEARNNLKKHIDSDTARQVSAELGEWIIKEMYDGIKANSKTQKGWDIELKNKKRIQVKTHSKHKTNTKNRWTYVNYGADAPIDLLIILVFSDELFIEEFYEISWQDAQKFISSKEKKSKPHINWDDIHVYKKDLRLLPKEIQILAVFNN